MEEEIHESNQIFDIQHGILISVTSSALHILKIRKKTHSAFFCIDLLVEINCR